MESYSKFSSPSRGDVSSSTPQIPDRGGRNGHIDFPGGEEGFLDDSEAARVFSIWLVARSRCDTPALLKAQRALRGFGVSVCNLGRPTTGGR